MPAQNLRGFTERVALVTNGSRGIGRAVALQLALQGAYVIVNYRDAEDESVVNELRELGTLAHAVRGDVSRSADVRLMFLAIEETFGRLDLLVNNAYANHEATLDELTEETWDRVLGLTLKGAFLCSQAAARLMRKRPAPAIVNIFSETALSGSAGSAALVAAQAGLAGLTKALARELSPPIRVNGVAVGGAQNALTINYYDWTQSLKRPHVKRDKPSGSARLAPDDIARACLYLLSSDAAAINGQTLVVGSDK
ncbi:MAG: SDR family oxidoreductase [Acidobacteria bacterium]|nr:SDR family oxidoreductase [Acidobacteriota bacterium]